MNFNTLQKNKIETLLKISSQISLENAQTIKFTNFFETLVLKNDYLRMKSTKSLQKPRHIAKLIADITEYLDRNQRFIDYFTPKPEQEIEVKHTEKQKFIAKNSKTGEVFSFDSPKDASIMFDVDTLTEGKRRLVLRLGINIVQEYDYLYDD